MAELLGLESARNLLRNGDLSRFGTSVNTANHLAFWTLSDSATIVGAEITPVIVEGPVNELTIPSGESITQLIDKPEWTFPSIRAFTGITVAYTGTTANLTGVPADVFATPTASWEGTIDRTIALQIGDLVQLAGDVVEDTGRYRVIRLDPGASEIDLDPVGFTPVTTSTTAVIIRSLQAYGLQYTIRWLQRSGTIGSSFTFKLGDTVATTLVSDTPTTSTVLLDNAVWTQHAAGIQLETAMPPATIDTVISCSAGTGIIANIALYNGIHVSFESGDLDLIGFGADQDNFLDPRGVIHMFQDEVSNRFLDLVSEQEVGSGTISTGSAEAIIGAVVYDASTNLTTLTLTETTLPKVMAGDRLTVAGGLAVRVEATDFVTSWPISTLNQSGVDTLVLLQGDLSDVFSPAGTVHFVYRAFLTYDTPTSAVLRLSGTGDDPAITDGTDRFKIIAETVSQAFSITTGAPIVAGDVVITPAADAATTAANAVTAINGVTALTDAGISAIVSGDDGFAVTSATSAVTLLFEMTDPGAMISSGLGHPIGAFVESGGLRTLTAATNDVLLDTELLEVGDVIELTSVVDPEEPTYSGTHNLTITEPRFVKVTRVDRALDQAKLSTLAGGDLNALFSTWYADNLGEATEPPTVGGGLQRDNEFRIFKRELGHTHFTVSTDGPSRRGDDLKDSNRKVNPDHRHPLLRDTIAEHFRTRMVERL